MAAPGLNNSVRAGIRKSIAGKIITACADYFGQDPYKKTRIRKTVECRMFCYLFLRRHTSMSLKSMGLLFGQDHTTVINALKTIKDVIHTDPNLRNHYYKLQSIIA